MTQTQTATKASSHHVKLKPLGNRVLVRRLAAEEKLKGGILLPDTAKKEARAGPSGGSWLWKKR